MNLSLNRGFFDFEQGICAHEKISLVDYLIPVKARVPATFFNARSIHYAWLVAAAIPFVWVLAKQVTLTSARPQVSGHENRRL